MTDPLAGVDIGGTKVLAVAVQPGAPELVIEEARAPTPFDGTDLVDTIVELVGRVAPTASALGVGIAGLVDRGGVVRTSPNLPGLHDFDLADRLARRVDLAVTVDNDANAAAAAEFAAGSAPGDGILVALGTGIGGAIVSGGRVQRGRNGFAGEFGHMTIVPGGVECVCGRRGCWERYASGSALVRIAAEHGVKVASGDITGEAVIDAARAGDERAVTAVDELCGWAGLGIANLVADHDPSVVVVGGGLLDAADVLLDRIRQAARAATFGAAHRAPVEVLPGRFGSRAGAVGAALLAAETAGPPLESSP